jgi:gamma-butyrobetaine dioxygenase
MQYREQEETRMASTPAIAPLSMSDLAPARTARSIVQLEEDGGSLTLVWDDGRRSRFPALWLRDNCPCPECRHPQALERTFLFVDHPAPRISAATLVGDGDVEVRFVAADGMHTSGFARGWLRSRCCSPEALAARVSAPLLWDAGIRERLPVLDYADYMHTDAGLRAWLEAVQGHGIVLLRGVPQVPGALLEVARRVGPIRASNFGEYYDVVSMPNPNASAYTSIGLELHTDLANWRFPPDVQLLSCLKSSVTGGESRFADGFRVAEDLRAADPEAFALLANQPLEFRFHDESCDIRTSAPTLQHDGQGRLQRIRFNNWLRTTMSLPEALIEPVYRALGLLWRMLREPRYHLELRLEPGQLIAYDNNRILHGRAAFDANSGERHLQGCYLNLEDVQSRLRLLDRLRA